jgi:mannosidase alpha-like ER degradation enhancer 1
LYYQKHSKWVNFPSCTVPLLALTYLRGNIAMYSAEPQYLYLLFNHDTDKTTRRPSNQVYTTEGHALSLGTTHLHAPSASRRQLHKGEVLQCPAYVPPSMGGVVVGIEGREDFDCARQLVLGPKDGFSDGERGDGSLYGYCSVPEVPRYVGHRGIKELTERPSTLFSRPWTTRAIRPPKITRQAEIK